MVLHVVPALLPILPGDFDRGGEVGALDRQAKRAAGGQASGFRHWRARRKWLRELLLPKPRLMLVDGEAVQAYALGMTVGLVLEDAALHRGQSHAFVEAGGPSLLPWAKPLRQAFEDVLVVIAVVGAAWFPHCLCLVGGARGAAFGAPEREVTPFDDVRPVHSAPGVQSVDVDFLD